MNHTILDFIISIWCYWNELVSKGIRHPEELSLARLLEPEELKKNKGVSATRRTKLPSGITAHNGNMSYDSGTIGSPMRLGSASTPQVGSNSNVKLMMMMMMTFLIAVYMRVKDMILVSIITFLRSGISKKLKSITWPWWFSFKSRSNLYFYVTFLIFGWIHATDLILVSILTNPRSGIMKKIYPHDLDVWPWNLCQAYFYMTFLILLFCIHDTDLILMSILTFSMSGISQ